MAAGNCHTKFI